MNKIQIRNELSVPSFALSLMKISVVNYLNSRPFVYGLQQHKISESIILSLDTPAACARKLINGEVQIGLVPVAAIPQIPNAEIITDYCIAADGDVTSVLLLSQMPLEKIKTILLDYQSMTSVTLVKILAKELWKISPEWKHADTGFEKTISQTTAAVVIGDRALEMHKQFEFVYDLSGEWKKLTSLPFVFACWVSNTKIENAFLQNFSQALQSGLNHIPEIVAGLKTKNSFGFDVQEYLQQHIKFKLDDEKKKGMKLFLEKLKLL